MSDHDRRVSDEIQNLDEKDLVSFKPVFEDKKLNKLFLNFKARNYPNSLNENEKELWFETVQSRVHNGEKNYLSIDLFFNQLEQLSSLEKYRHLVKDLEEYVRRFL